MSLRGPNNQVTKLHNASLGSNDITNQGGTSSDIELDQENLRTASLGKARS